MKKINSTIWKLIFHKIRNYHSHGEIVHYDTSAMKRFLTSVSLQHEPKASSVITLVKKTFFRTSIVRNFISRGVKMRIFAREASVRPHLRTRSDIKIIIIRIIIMLILHKTGSENLCFGLYLF